MVKILDKRELDLLLKKFASNFPLIINLSNQKGGVGKSILAYNIADAFRILGFKVRLLDLDNQRTCSMLNRLRENPFTDIERVLEEEKFIERINNSYSDGSEILVIDTCSFDSALFRLAIMGADINLTPMSDKVTELLAVTQTYSQILKELERDTDNALSAHILLNRIHSSTRHFEHIESLIESNSKMSMVKSIVRNRSIYDKSLIDGRTIFEAESLKGYSEAKDEILSLCYELIKIDIKRRG